MLSWRLRVWLWRTMSSQDRIATSESSLPYSPAKRTRMRSAIMVANCWRPRAVTARGPKTRSARMVTLIEALEARR